MWTTIFTPFPLACLTQRQNQERVRTARSSSRRRALGHRIADTMGRLPQVPPRGVARWVEAPTAWPKPAAGEGAASNTRGIGGSRRSRAVPSPFSRPCCISVRAITAARCPHFLGPLRLAQLDQACARRSVVSQHSVTVYSLRMNLGVQFSRPCRASPRPLAGALFGR
jgi:hypothetical protein